MHPQELLRGMREELTNIGFHELRTAKDVDAALQQEKRTVLVVVNSVCGCAAGRARPAVAMALTHQARPEILATVFAGQDREATEQARSYFTGYAPSSPCIALLRDGKVAFMLERHAIEGRDPHAIAADLTRAFDRFCTPAAGRVTQ
jgi:putative YphP/YqiW family bacilliredoxin